MICPQCGFQFSDDPLLHTLYEIQRDFGVIRTKTLAALLPVSEVTAWRTLGSLEKQGVVYRKTKKTGYYLARENGTMVG